MLQVTNKPIHVMNVQGPDKILWTYDENAFKKLNHSNWFYSDWSHQCICQLPYKNGFGFSLLLVFFLVSSSVWIVYKAEFAAFLSKHFLTCFDNSQESSIVSLLTFSEHDTPDSYYCNVWGSVCPPSFFNHLLTSSQHRIKYLKTHKLCCIHISLELIE